MRGKSFGTVASPVVALGRSTGSGVALIARRYFYASTTSVVPSGASRATVRCVGGGASYQSSNNAGGGGGAFARDDIPCAPGQTATITIPAVLTGANRDGGNTSVSLNSRSVVAAGAVATAGGLASASTGTVVRQGGSGGAPGNPGASGTAGWPGGNGGTNDAGTSIGGGGGPASDIGDTDALNVGGPGASMTLTPPNGWGYGGGGCLPFSGSGKNGPMSGMAVIEFWSA